MFKQAKSDSSELGFNNPKPSNSSVQPPAKRVRSTSLPPIRSTSFNRDQLEFADTGKKAEDPLHYSPKLFMQERHKRQIEAISNAEVAFSSGV